MLQTSLSIKMAVFSIATCETEKTLLKRNHQSTKRDIFTCLFFYFILPASLASGSSFNRYISHPLRLKASSPS